MVHNDVLDGALNIIKNGATQICVDTIAAAPTTYEEAVTTNMLAIYSTATAGNFIVDDGAVGAGYGRELNIAQFATIEVINSGTAGHIALCDVDDRLLYVTTCTSQALTDGNTVTIPTWIITIADPT
jgi:hypothetical protein